VNNVAPDSCSVSALRDRPARRPYLAFQLLISLWFFGLVCGSAAASADFQTTLPAAPGLGLPFAIADFDGDRNPDVASIQAMSSNAGKTDYWIQLQLSAAGRRSIRVSAPSGGLQIEARDVNGDHAVDLVVSTAWRRQPVAIFLNDGHGGFSRAELTAFPGAFSNSKTDLVSSWPLLIDALGLAPQLGASVCREERDSLLEPSPAGLILASSAGFPPKSLLASHAGRAPPPEVIHS
jgi:hypothetical protein